MQDLSQKLFESLCSANYLEEMATLFIVGVVVAIDALARKYGVL